MTEGEILKLRLNNHLITQGKLNTPESVVSWMGAIQAQDYGQAKYAIGSRMINPKNSDIEQALNDKRIVRTWGLRGTLHILASVDIQWILPLVTSSIITRYQPQFKRLSLDDGDFIKIQDCIIQLLKGGIQLTRKELFEGLEQSNISTSGLRGAYILYKAGWLGIICLGSMKGKQDSYTLLEEWLPKLNEITREEAVAKLAQRYFQSHGPATLKDFILWSGLSITEARAGFELIREKLIKIEMNTQLYWMMENNLGTTELPRNSYFLAGFDEYLLGYKDRSLILDSANTKKVILQNGIFKPIIIENGKIIGTWKRVINKNKISIVTDVFDSMARQNDFFSNEIKEYASFVNS